MYLGEGSNWVQDLLARHLIFGPGCLAPEPAATIDRQPGRAEEASKEQAHQMTDQGQTAPAARITGGVLDEEDLSSGSSDPPERSSSLSAPPVIMASCA